MPSSPDDIFNSIPKDRPKLSLRDAGCVCDGVTDDTGNAQSAFDYAARYGLELVVPGPTFISNNLVISSGGWTLSGNGWSSSFICATNMNKYAIVFNQPQSFGITGMLFQHFKIDCGSQNSNTAGGIDANGSYRNVFSHLWIHNPMTAGLLLHFGPGGGFGFQNFVSHCQIEGGNVPTGGHGRGLWVVNCDENHFHHNHFQNNGGTSGSDNFHVRDENGLNDYVGNDFVNGKGGIKMYATSQSSNRIIGNIFDGCAQGNIVDSGNGGNLVLGNKFLNIGFGAASPNSASGFYTNGKGNNVCHNHFNPDGSGTNGNQAYVFFDSSSTLNQASDNMFQTINAGGATIINNGVSNTITPNISGI